MIGKIVDSKALNFLAVNAEEKQILSKMWFDRNSLAQSEKDRYNKLAKAWNTKVDASDIGQKGLVKVALI